MSTCHRCKCDTRACGCQDGPLTTIPLYQDSSTCPNAQVCAEFTYTGCIIYNGPQIVGMEITPGMNFNQVLQALVRLDTGSPPCSTTSLLLLLNTITKTTIDVGWQLISSAVSYTVKYSVTGSGVWTSLTSVSPSTAHLTIPSLACATSYDIRVTVNYATSACDSLTIRVSTLTC